MNAKKINAKTLFVIIFLAFIIVVYALAYSGIKPFQVPYPSGWEVHSDIKALYTKGTYMTSQTDFTSPNYLGVHYWNVDPDYPDYGMSTLTITQGDVQHSDALGRWTSDTAYVDTRAVTRGNYTYYLDYHIFMFDVTIRTVADAKDIGWDIFGTHWAHETSYGDGWGKNGIPFKGGVLVQFQIDIWNPYRTAPTSEYTLKDVWAGIMQTYIYDVESGAVSGAVTSDTEQYARPNLAKGSTPDMYTTIAGLKATTVSWGVASPDMRIPSSVYVYLPVELQAGAHIVKDVLTRPVNLQPSDVYVKYKLRVDVLTVHGFYLQTGYKPPAQEAPAEYMKQLTSFWDGVFASLGSLNPFGVFGPAAGLVATAVLLIFIVVVIYVVVKVIFKR